MTAQLAVEAAAAGQLGVAAFEMPSSTARSLACRYRMSAANHQRSGTDDAQSAARRIRDRICEMLETRIAALAENVEQADLVEVQRIARATKEVSSSARRSTARRWPPSTSRFPPSAQPKRTSGRGWSNANTDGTIPKMRSFPTQPSLIHRVNTASPEPRARQQGSRKGTLCVTTTGISRARRDKRPQLERPRQGREPHDCHYKRHYKGRRPRVARSPSARM
jgi:hypothetical protein